MWISFRRFVWANLKGVAGPVLPGRQESRRLSGGVRTQGSPRRARFRLVASPLLEPGPRSYRSHRHRSPKAGQASSPEPRPCPRATRQASGTWRPQPPGHPLKAKASSAVGDPAWEPVTGICRSRLRAPGARHETRKKRLLPPPNEEGEGWTITSTLPFRSIYSAVVNTSVCIGQR
jgi:hypothetical protein